MKFHRFTKQKKKKSDWLITIKVAASCVLIVILRRFFVVVQWKSLNPLAFHIYPSSDKKKNESSIIGIFFFFLDSINNKNATDFTKCLRSFDRSQWALNDLFSLVYNSLLFFFFLLKYIDNYGPYKNISFFSNCFMSRINIVWKVNKKMAKKNFSMNSAETAHPDMLLIVAIDNCNSLKEK